MKNYLKSYLYLISIIIDLAIVLTIINYFISFNTDTIKIFIPIIAIFISSIILGKKTIKKAYLEGLKYVTPYIILVIILNLLIKSSFNFKQIFLYFLLIMTSMLGGMIGINIKSNKKT